MKNSIVTMSTIENIFNQSFVDITKKVALLDIIEETPTHSEIEDLYSGIIITNGVYNSILICTMHESVMKEISKGMNNGKKVDSEDIELYVGEYLNIVCGNALTQINNLAGKASRLSVPVIIKGPYQKNEEVEYEQMIEFNFSSWYGLIRVNMEYTFSSS
ncbi:chemotaxis protein CheX [Anaeromicropila herbilytica]|uniref:Chemotaxis phosphatase CheX-like domain-containing protein n=1 Tax=Anaeromicropila herbilytica TaxID=2785025 RepID=A0A7R7EJ42_9FIRM|nr:chemotaxis protein CheX [Anaeromicropila herbilytica]BCN29645.1 hypothetical protein bsdtb5_09400 [Anaeromicropila herbilytica]